MKRKETHLISVWLPLLRQAYYEFVRWNRQFLLLGITRSGQSPGLVVKMRNWWYAGFQGTGKASKQAFRFSQMIMVKHSVMYLISKS